MSKGVILPEPWAAWEMCTVSSASPARKDSNMERQKLLIVDDIPENLQGLACVLMDNYEVFAATNGNDALTAARIQMPDLILLDVMMPGMDGYEVFAGLKQDGGTSDIPVIFITAKTDAESETRALSAGAVDFIHKPFNKEVVRSRVKLQLELVRQRRHLEKLNRQLVHIAYHDALTDLPNRTMFFDLVAKALALARRSQTNLAVIFIDLDRFKQVNDNYGHAVGDQVLQVVAARISDCVRESDSVGRIGGDEFVLLLQDISSEDAAVMVAEKIRDAMNQPLTVSGLTLSISSSIGVAIYPEHGNNAAELVKSSDAAMYLAKECGRDNVKVFTS